MKPDIHPDYHKVVFHDSATGADQVRSVRRHEAQGLAQGASATQGRATCGLYVRVVRLDAAVRTLRVPDVRSRALCNVREPASGRVPLEA